MASSSLSRARPFGTADHGRGRGITGRGAPNKSQSDEGPLFSYLCLAGDQHPSGTTPCSLQKVTSATVYQLDGRASGPSVRTVWYFGPQVDCALWGRSQFMKYALRNPTSICPDANLDGRCLCSTQAHPGHMIHSMGKTWGQTRSYYVQGTSSRPGALPRRPPAPTSLPLQHPCRIAAIDFPVTGCNRRIAESYSLGRYLGIFRDLGLVHRVMTLHCRPRPRPGQDRIIK